MSRRTERRRRKFAARGRTGEVGLSLIELLLSLAILSILVGFVAGGLSLARRAFSADLQSEIASGTDGGIEAVASLVASAMRVPPAGGHGRTEFVFEGTSEELVFVGLSEGRSFRGGPQTTSVRRSGSDLIVDVAPTTKATDTSAAALPGVVVLRGVRGLRFGYFGATNTSRLPGWQSDWISAERLPELVSIQVDFEDARRNGPSRVVALRQK